MTRTSRPCGKRRRRMSPGIQSRFRGTRRASSQARACAMRARGMRPSVHPDKRMDDEGARDASATRLLSSSNAASTIDPLMPDHDTYESPLASRNASPQMLRLFSPRHKFALWRKLWLELARCERELGLTRISDEAL